MRYTGPSPSPIVTNKISVEKSELGSSEIPPPPPPLPPPPAPVIRGTN